MAIGIGKAARAPAFIPLMPTAPLNPVTCARCGYDVRGHDVGARCSECGARIEVVDDRAREARVARLTVSITFAVVAIYAGVTRLGGDVFVHPGRSKPDIAALEVESIRQQVLLWTADHGHATLPPDFDPIRLTHGDDPYLRPKDLLDPWDRPYRVIVGASGFQVVSLGADGLVGGRGEDADIVE